MAQGQSLSLSAKYKSSNTIILFPLRNHCKLRRWLSL
jgi:hypothetical protein